jgi:repressor of nif and glnA expression
MKMNLPWVESPFFEKILHEKKLTQQQGELARIYNKDGYIVLKNVFTEEEVNQVVSEMHEKGFNTDYTLIKTRD